MKIKQLLCKLISAGASKLLCGRSSKMKTCVKEVKGKTMSEKKETKKKVTKKKDTKKEVSTEVETAKAPSTSTRKKP